MKPRLYLETTIPSYLVARRSRDAILHGQQAATRKWWDERRGDYELFLSEFVDLEAGRGDAEMAVARAAALEGLPRLAATEDARKLAVEILSAGLIPAHAAVDASHIAVAAVHRMDILLTWNCTHSITSPSAGRSSAFARGRAGPVLPFAPRSTCWNLEP